MSFANPWGLLALLALPAIAAIHLYHRRFPPLVVAGVHLWGVQHEVRTAGRTLERLPITASLLLELLAAFLLAMILAQPRFGELGSATHLVVVLDNSASMQSQPEAARTFRDDALRELDERLSDLSRSSRVTVLLTGARPETLAGPAVRVDEARSRLASWQPTAARHDFGPAWDRAAQFAGEAGQLLFLSDHLLSETVTVPERMESVAVGAPLPNVAVAAARWQVRPDTKTGQVYLRLVNYSAGEAVASVRGRAGETVVFTQPVTIGVGGEMPLLVDVPKGLGQLDVDVSTPRDGLELDNLVTLIEPRPRTVKVAVRFPEGDPTAAAVARALETVPDVKTVPVDEADLVITVPAPLPRSDRELWWLGVGPLDRSEAAREASVDLRGPYILEKRHPLVEGLALGGLTWGGVQPMGLDADAQVSSDQTPLLAQLTGTRTTAFLLNVDLDRSQLAESENWPILVSNLVELRRDDLPGLGRWNYRTGERVRFRWPIDKDVGDLRLVSGGESRPLARDTRGVVEIAGLDRPGVYEIREGDTLVDRFAVNFHDPRESVLTDLGSGTHEPEDATFDESFRLDNPYSWLILLALGVVVTAALVDWRVVRG
jgi:hypothetical protein